MTVGINIKMRYMRLFLFGQKVHEVYRLFFYEINEVYRFFFWSMRYIDLKIFFKKILKYTTEKAHICKE